MVVDGPDESASEGLPIRPDVQLMHPGRALLSEQVHAGAGDGRRVQTLLAGYAEGVARAHSTRHRR
jgi:hypothetical protein